MKPLILVSILTFFTFTAVAYTNDPQNNDTIDDCILSIEKRGSTCYIVESCWEMDCDPETNECTWESVSDIISGPVPCLNDPILNPYPF